MKILREFYFADWRFLWFAGTNFYGSRWQKLEPAKFSWYTVGLMIKTTALHLHHAF